MGYAYILASRKGGALYVGVTSNLEKRIQEHKMKIHDGYTSKYGITRLVRYQQYQNIQEAIESEKRLKGRKRDRKIKLIEEGNPEWIDLSEGGL